MRDQVKLHNSENFVLA